MTREKVIKALECCSDDSMIGECTDCPLVEANYCIQVLHKEALKFMIKENAKNEHT